VWHVVKQQKREELRLPFKFFLGKKINELVTANNKLTNSFVGSVTSGLGPDVANGPPVGNTMLSGWTKGVEVLLMVCTFIRGRLHAHTAPGGYSQMFLMRRT
jgi:hypothetical protein